MLGNDDVADKLGGDEHLIDIALDVLPLEALLMVPRVCLILLSLNRLFATSKLTTDGKEPCRVCMCVCNIKPLNLTNIGYSLS